MFESLTLIQTHKIKNFPVVLFGSGYWGKLLDWVRDYALTDGKVSEHDLTLLHLTDSPAEVVEIIRRSEDPLNAGDDLVTDEIRSIT